MKRMKLKVAGILTACWALVPSILWAAGGPASELVVVADTRMLDSGIMKYFSDLYNHDMLTFAIWAVVLTAGYGAFLGYFMDKIMAHTGLDLKSRKIIEH